MMDEVKEYMYPLMGFYSISVLFGLTTNFIMLWVSYRVKRLRNNCHILIATRVASDFLHQGGHFVFLFNLYNRFSTIPQNICLYLQTMPIIGLLMGVSLLFSLGIDRLLAVVHSMKYRSYSSMRGYLFALFVFPILFTAAHIFDAYRNVDPNKQTICGIPEGFNGPSNRRWSNSIILLNVVVLFIYTAVALNFAVKRTQTQSFNRSIFTSIFIVMAVVVFGWMLTMSINTAASHLFNLKESTLMLIQMYAGLPLNIAFSLNLIIYYKRSSEYHAAIVECFPFLKKQGEQVKGPPSTKVKEFPRTTNIYHSASSAV